MKLKLFWRYGRTEDLIQAVEKGKIAVAKTSEQHEAFTERLNNLGIILANLYKRTDKIEDLEEAIRVTRQAVKATPEDHPNLAACPNNLGNKLGSRYERTGKIEEWVVCGRLMTMYALRLRSRSIPNSVKMEV